MKWICFCIFGLATLFLVFPLMPLLMLFLRPAEKFRSRTRRMISGWFRIFIAIMRGMRVLELETDDRERFRNLRSKIVAANHPSLLDVVMLISLIPNADVIVRGSLAENIILSKVVSALYILSSLDFNEIAAAAKKSLEQGNCLVIFPEGTRTPRSGEMRLKKGAARLSLLTGADIVAAYIGGTDKYGLGKRDPLFSFNHTDKYIYRVSIRRELSPEKYAGMENHRAVRRLNAELLEMLRPESFGEQ